MIAISAMPSQHGESVKIIYEEGIARGNAFFLQIKEHTMHRTYVGNIFSESLVQTAIEVKHQLRRVLFTKYL
jgi:hypothetical protein